jgi:chromosome segregation ATPase
MDKENLQTKVEALQDNLKVKHDELTEIQEQLNVARNELANANKPTLSQDTLVVLVEKMQDIFQDALNEADPNDLSPEFSLDYGNEVRLDCVDMSAIEIHACDIESVLEEVFNIVSDNS